MRSKILPVPSLLVLALVIAGCGQSPSGERAQATPAAPPAPIVWPSAEPPRLPSHARALLGRSGPFQSWASAVGFTPDGKALYSAGRSGVLHFWDAKTGAPLASAEAHAPERSVRRVAFCAERGSVITLGGDYTARAFKLGSLDDAGWFRLSGSGDYRAISKDGRRVAGSIRFQKVGVWSTDTGQKLCELPCASELYSVDLSGDGTVLLTGRYQKPLELWDVEKGELLRPLADSVGYEGFARLSDDARLVAAAGNGGVVLWDVTTGQVVRKLTGVKGQLSCFAFAPAGRSLAVGTESGGLAAWNTAEGTLRFNANASPQGITDLGFSPDGGRLVTGGLDSRLRTFDATSGAPMLTATECAGNITKLSMSADGGEVVALGGDGTVRRWDVARRTEIERISRPGEVVVGLAATRDGRRLALVNAEGKARGHDVERRAAGPDVAATCKAPLCLAPDGLRLTCLVSERAVGLADLLSGKLLSQVELPRDTPLPHLVTHEGQLLIWGQESYPIRIWTDRTKTMQDLPQHQSFIRRLALSPDGAQLAACFDDGRIATFDTATGKPRGVMTGKKDWVRAIAFSPDGRRLASMGDDDLVRLWALSTFEQISEFAGHERSGNSLAFSKDGKSLASGGLDGTIYVWDVSGL